MFALMFWFTLYACTQLYGVVFHCDHSQYADSIFLSKLLGFSCPDVVM